MAKTKSVVYKIFEPYKVQVSYLREYRGKDYAGKQWINYIAGVLAEMKPGGSIEIKTKDTKRVANLIISLKKAGNPFVFRISKSGAKEGHTLVFKFKKSENDTTNRVGRKRVNTSN